jgi:hypothetical protein
MAFKGRYKPKNPEKYIGDTSNIVWRSLWERILMVWLDTSQDVLKWSSESVVVPYICATDGKMHRYFVDFWVSLKDGQKWLIEVKPDAQTKLPKTSNKMDAIRPKTNARTRMKLLREAKTYAKNESKWKAATEFANKHGMKFVILTEKNVQSIIGIRFVADGKSVRRL